ncbi:hypothetical protein B5X24_HaOG204447 [Helicoverpa armigera]|uniref:Uncharacterized protein n=1 Tax=Helicoverpa armigera TaxID=29058 RepID=A0A2W1BNL8_HELAM|nr:hypothetical protein B5X24_HaOG204447 [Helicoverpa armigera]
MKQSRATPSAPHITLSHAAFTVDVAPISIASSSSLSVGACGGSRPVGPRSRRVAAGEATPVAARCVPALALNNRQTRIQMSRVVAVPAEPEQSLLDPIYTYVCIIYYLFVLEGEGTGAGGEGAVLSVTYRQRSALSSVRY